MLILYIFLITIVGLRESLSHSLSNKYGKIIVHFGPYIVYTEGVDTQGDEFAVDVEITWNVEITKFQFAGGRCGPGCQVQLRVCVLASQKKTHQFGGDRNDSTKMENNLCNGKDTTTFEHGHHFKSMMEEGKDATAYVAHFIHWDQFNYGSFKVAKNNVIHLWIEIGHLKVKTDVSGHYYAEWTLMDNFYRLITTDQLEINAGPQQYILRSNDMRKANPGWRKSYMLMNMATQCQPMYYGCSCDRFCADTFHYYCHQKTGDKVCHQNYYNPPKCDKNCRPEPGTAQRCDWEGNLDCKDGYIKSKDPSNLKPSRNAICDRLNCERVHCVDGKRCQDTNELKRNDHRLVDLPSEEAAPMLYARCVYQ